MRILAIIRLSLPTQSQGRSFSTGLEGYLKGFFADGMWCKTKDVFHIEISVIFFTTVLLLMGVCVTVVELGITLSIYNSVLFYCQNKVKPPLFFCVIFTALFIWLLSVLQTVPVVLSANVLIIKYIKIYKY